MTDIPNLAAVAVGTELLSALNARLTEYRAIRSKMDADMASIEGAISLIVNNVPGHEWDGTALRIQNPDGSFGEAVQLGLPGPPGDAATIEIRSVRAVVGNELPRAVNVGTPEAAIYDLVVPKVIVNALNMSVPQNIAYVGQVV